MAKDEQRITIAKPADEVWAVAGDFGGLATWFPGMAACTLEGDDRHLDMGGMKVVERLYERDDAARTYTYGIVDGVPVEHHRATVTVSPSGDGSEVVWAYDVRPDEMTPMLGGAYTNALQALKAKLEG
jgi:mxaD protein